jgi:hypothetical protein
MKNTRQNLGAHISLGGEGCRLWRAEVRIVLTHTIITQYIMADGLSRGFREFQLEIFYLHTEYFLEVFVTQKIPIARGGERFTFVHVDNMTAFEGI